MSFGCPNPFDLELTPEILQAGERLSQEIANIQNGLQGPDLPEPCASSLPVQHQSPPGTPAKRLTSTLQGVEPKTLRPSGPLKARGLN